MGTIAPAACERKILLGVPFLARKVSQVIG